MIVDDGDPLDFECRKYAKQEIITEENQKNEISMCGAAQRRKATGNANWQCGGGPKEGGEKKNA